MIWGVGVLVKGLVLVLNNWEGKIGDGVRFEGTASRKRKKGEERETIRSEETGAGVGDLQGMRVEHGGEYGKIAFILVVF